MDDIKKVLKKKNKTYRIILISLSTVLWAILYNLFLLPMKLVTGGTNGVATITNYLYGIDPAVMIFLLAAACAIISFMYLGMERTMTSLAASIAYPVLVKLTANITNIIEIDYSDFLLLVIFAAVLCGVANGLMYKSGYNNGGFPVISQILYDKYKISVAKSSLVINVVIVLIGAFFFGTTNALYAIIYIYISNLVLDKVLLGISNNKAFYIITTKEEEIKEYILRTLQHSITTFDVKGGFLDNKRKVMLTVIPSREYYRLTEGIKSIDADAFFVVTDSYQVEGAK
ncbi:MAG: YitT family protein [Bacilli bacterium]|nr:YitT family protein [Bacilli bacterium]